MKKSHVFLATLLLIAPVAAHAQSAPTPSTALFATEATAQQHCPTGTVVWVDNRTNIYYVKTQNWYGNTKRGSFVCEQDAKKLGDHAAKSDK